MRPISSIFVDPEYGRQSFGDLFALFAQGARAGFRRATRTSDIISNNRSQVDASPTVR